MTQPQQNRLTMNKAVATHNKNNEAIWQGLPAYVRAQAELETCIAGRNEALQIQTQTTTGITEDKAANTGLAVSRVLMLARNAAAYALDAQNHDLFARLNYSKSYLLGLTDNVQIAALREILHKIEPQLPNLGDYGVTEGMIKDARALVAKIDVEQTKARGVVTEKSTARFSVPELEAKSRHALSVMDRLVHNFAEKYPDFVTQYLQARIILDLGKRHEAGDDQVGGDSETK